MTIRNDNLLTNPFIYDEEQFRNYHCIGFLSLRTNIIKRFEVYVVDNTYVLNDLEEFVKFVNWCIDHKATWIGFNNLKYDYPKSHYIIDNTVRTRRESRFNFLNLTPNTLMDSLFEKSQDLVKNVFGKNRVFIPSESQHIIKQIDLMAIWHFNNKAKLTSLKALEIAMRLNNVEDMPLSFDATVLQEHIPIIRKYNDNDLYATAIFYELTRGWTEDINLTEEQRNMYTNQDKLLLRKELSDAYKVNMMNMNDVAIGKEICLQILSQETGMNVDDLRKLRTWRKEVNLKDAIPSFISYKTSEINKVLDYFKTAKMSMEDVEEEGK